MQETWVQSLWEDPLEEGIATHSRIPRTEAWRVTVQRVAKSPTQLK